MVFMGLLKKPIWNEERSEWRVEVKDVVTKVIEFSIFNDLTATERKMSLGKINVDGTMTYLEV